ncbi:MAG: hypothetical protein OXE84_08355 [Rhodobacteraceae bacterium]|nr:hypothetical protein [Paracoccaceae bacterium]
MEPESPFQPGFHHRAVRHLNGDPDGLRLGTGRRHNPIGHVGPTRAAVRQGPFPAHSPVAIADADRVGL